MISPSPRTRPILADIASILRGHIILIGATAAVVFGWIFTDQYLWGVAAIGGVDWLLINLLNRVTDTEEDLANRIPGTDLLVSVHKLVLAIWIAIAVGSFVVSHLIWPELTPWRLVVQLIGVGYSYRIVATPKGRRRFKDLYFLKNFMSSVLFVHTVFIYPIVAAGVGVVYAPGWAGVVWLAAFFVVFEITYEILYDMRDLEGDRPANVPTYPVVHGLVRSRQIIDGLLLISAAILILAFLTGGVGARELLMVAAPLIQFLFYRPRFRRGLTTVDCIRLTHLGSVLLIIWLIGTRLWQDAGLPNYYSGLCG